MHIHPAFQEQDSSPITWWGRIPVYASTLLVVAHCACFVFVALAAPLGYGPLISHLQFSSADLLGSFQIWQAVTYGFIPQLSLWFLVEMAMLYFFGQEVEKFIGRNSFLTLYGILLLLPPLFLTAAALLGYPTVLSGAGSIHFALFVAFAAISPNALMFFGIPSKWIAVGFFVFYTVLLIGGMAWTPLSVMWIDVAAALLFLRACGIHSLQFTLPIPGKVPARIIPFPAPAVKKTAPRLSKSSKQDPVQGIDPILEKISRTGLQSLTEAERAKLERARAALLEKDRPE